MAKDGLLLSLCAGVVTGLGTMVLAQDTDRDRQINDTLAVQSALQRGREMMQRNDYASAVYILEGQLARINGNTVYLGLLREAYRGHVKELRLASKEAEAQRYLQRLQVLDPGASLDQGKASAAASAAQVKPYSGPMELEPAPAVVPASHKEQAPPVTVNDKAEAGKALLAQADKEFTQRRYREAGSLYEQIARSDAKLLDASKERWAYCKLYRVVEKLNQAGGTGLPLSELETEVKLALELAPQLSYGKELLTEIAKRKSANATAAAAVTVKHVVPKAGSNSAETTNFRIFHNQSQQLAEQIAQIAERTRAEMGQKWFGGLKENWNPRCDIYLYATSADYSKATGVPNGSPGHSSIQYDGARVLSRRIDLHCDSIPNLLMAVLPHETTHVVLAGNFDQPVPRWADEGIAVLTEPREKVELHLNNLSKCRQENALFPVRQLILMQDYPEPRQISAFYAQSVSLVEYLTNERGPQVFTAFLREALKSNNFEQALQRHYGYRNFDELQQRWSAKALSAPGVARGQ